MTFSANSLVLNFASSLFMLPNCNNNIRLRDVEGSRDLGQLLHHVVRGADDDIAGIDDVGHFGGARLGRALCVAARPTWLVRPARIVAR